MKSNFEKDLEAQIRAEVAKILDDMELSNHPYYGTGVDNIDAITDRLVKLALSMY